MINGLLHDQEREREVEGILKKFYKTGKCSVKVVVVTPLEKHTTAVALKVKRSK